MSRAFLIALVYHQVVEMSSEGVRACEQLHAVAANYTDRGARDQLERYGRAIRYYSFLERVGLCSIILNFSAPGTPIQSSHSIGMIDQAVRVY